MYECPEILKAKFVPFGSENKKPVISYTYEALTGEKPKFC
jgi:hypothetical protein